MLRARGEPHAFDVLRGGLKIARVEWSLLGEHNQLNALAAIAAAEHVGVVARGLGARAGELSQRQAPRSSCAATPHGVSVYDDFAHHPTAMRTTIDGLRQQGRRARASSPSSSRARTR